MINVGDTQYRGEDHDAREGYHEYRGGVQYRGGKIYTNAYPSLFVKHEQEGPTIKLL